MWSGVIFSQNQFCLRQISHAVRRKRQSCEDSERPQPPRSEVVALKAAVRVSLTARAIKIAPVYKTRKHLTWKALNGIISERGSSERAG